MPKIFITRPIPDQGINLLKEKGYELSIYSKDEIIPRKELLKGVKGADALLSILTDKIDAEVMDAAGSQLKIIANYAVGFDNIDLAAAKERTILVANAPGPEITETVAEHTFTLMLALARRLVESDGFARAGKYNGWGPQLLLGTDVYGKKLGIVGLGRIGFAVAERAAKGFKMKILYNDVKQNAEFEKMYNAEFRALPDLLKEADFVSLHVPLLPATHHLISREQFALMKPTAFLVNTARGPVVDEKALLEALAQKKIAGAALDVFECEPSIDCDINDHWELKNFPNVILTPHTASATIEARQAMSRTAAENIIAAFEGSVPPNLVKS
ncbi:MAG: D-glycerate dehydrogenase [bacterium]|nr:D-glycerate dehydrogenase [bacterium]